MIQIHPVSHASSYLAQAKVVRGALATYRITFSAFAGGATRCFSPSGWTLCGAFDSPEQANFSGICILSAEGMRQVS